MDNIVFIAGPTSSGKTSLAIKLCKKYNGEIVSADSRQIYKEFNVGTGKIPIGSGIEYKKGEFSWQLDGVNSWLYDVVDPLSDYSVVDFKNDALKALKDIKDRKKLPFIVGGTGFYLDSLLGYEVDIRVIKNVELRTELEGLSLRQLQEMIPSEIRNTLNSSDFNNPVRLIRKIEILKSGGQIKRKHEQVSPLEKNLIVLKRNRDVIYSRVDEWVEQIWIPLIIEVKHLIDLGYEESHLMKGIIYKTALEEVKGDIDEKIAKERVKFDLHSYIRRQETWFKKYKDATVLNPDVENFDEEVYKTVESIIYGRRKI